MKPERILFVAEFEEKEASMIEATAVVDTGFTFNRRRVLLEAQPLIESGDFQEEIRRFRKKFWCDTAGWAYEMFGCEIIDWTLLKEEEKEASMTF